jgi:hypothetical protein
MKLKEYLEIEDITAAKFARKIQVSPMKVYMILHQEGDMLLSIALRIQKETKGKVKPHELINEKVWKESQRKKGKA